MLLLFDCFFQEDITVLTELVRNELIPVLEEL